MNYLENTNKLNNEYFSFRHGHALNNERCLIVSDPVIGIANYELTEKGRKEIKESVIKALNKNIINENSLIITSDFRHTVEGAMIAHEKILCTKPYTSTKLRERNFGNFEGRSSLYYEDVWANDQKDPNHHHDNVESVNEVLKRTTSLITELERNFSGQSILLSSHGDTLQILQTAFKKIPASQHRTIPHLKNAEIRKLILAK